MNEMELVSYERFGPVRFGATEEEVIAAMTQADPALRWIRREVHSVRVSMINFWRHARVEFDEHGRCMHVAILFHDVVPVVDGDLRLTGDFEGVVGALRQRGFEIRPGPQAPPRRRAARGVRRAGAGGGATFPRRSTGSAASRRCEKTWYCQTSWARKA